MAFTAQAERPFIAWSCAQDYNQFPPNLQVSCEKHLRKSQEQISSLIGPPGVEGFILYDQLQRGMAVASLLAREGKTLPENSDGASCDHHFDEDLLCQATNALAVEARLHEGSRGMLVRLGVNSERRFILLDQRQATRLHPMGNKDNPDLSLAAYGLLAHELAHARDYADGRPGLPSLQEVSTHVAPGQASAVHTITDMALAEYIATRAECRAQIDLRGACSHDLTQRIGQMAAKNLTLPDLDDPLPQNDDAVRQRRMDLSNAGYFIGTLAAYREAKAPIQSAHGDRHVTSTDRLLSSRMPKGSHLGAVIDRVAPMLERAASSPHGQGRADLASKVAEAIKDAKSVPTRQSSPKTHDASLFDWFPEL